MSLSSSSTYEDALDQYNDNLNWQGDAAKASLALEAVRWILMNRSKIIAISGRSTTINFEAMLDEKTRLEEYVARHGSAVNRAAFTQGRPIC